MASTATVVVWRGTKRNMMAVLCEEALSLLRFVYVFDLSLALHFLGESFWAPPPNANANHIHTSMFPIHRGLAGMCPLCVWSVISILMKSKPDNLLVNTRNHTLAELRLTLAGKLQSMKCGS